MIYQCPKCLVTFGFDDTENNEGLTADCLNCGTLLLIQDHRAVDFHEHYNKLNPNHPKDGVGVMIVKLDPKDRLL